MADGDGWRCHCPSDSVPSLAPAAGDGVGARLPRALRRRKHDPAWRRACRRQRLHATRRDLPAVPHRRRRGRGPRRAVGTGGAEAGAVDDALGRRHRARRYEGAARWRPTTPTPGAAASRSRPAAPSIRRGKVLRSVPGTPGPASVAAERRHAAGAESRPPTASSRRSLGVWPDTYRLQPAALRVDCPVGGCRPDAGRPRGSQSRAACCGSTATWRWSPTATSAARPSR